MSATNSSIDGRIVHEQDCASVVDEQTVRKQASDFEGEVTGIAETVEAALSEIGAEL